MGILHGSIPESDTVKSFSEDDDIYENISEENFSDSPKTQDVSINPYDINLAVNSECNQNSRELIR